MSYDLAVWYPHRSFTDSQAQKIYSALCRGEPTALKAHRAVERFYADLAAAHPGIDDIPEDNVEDLERCPWSCVHDYSDRHVIMCMTYSRAQATQGVISKLAQKNGLCIFDPQSGKIHHPKPGTMHVSWRFLEWHW